MHLINKICYGCDFCLAKHLKYLEKTEIYYIKVFILKLK